ncbi:MAG TPA: hypothetical protein VG273_02280 [Bryobacteraceae bacterium]|jgi:hypothetical protein|nr:hypothetical protein [Bryobacteraceae bacterium]
MACPLFLPSARLGDFDDVYSGECAADPGAIVPVDVLRLCCNRGYARGTCQRAAQAEADAFRFLIRAAGRGTVEVAWSIERDHHPVAVGKSAITDSTARSNQPLERQALVCAMSLLRP